MKFLFILAVTGSVSLGCGVNRNDSAAQLRDAVPSADTSAPDVVKPEFEQFVSIDVKSDDVEIYKALIADYAKVSRSEPGNIIYAVYQSIDNPVQFEIHETWRTDASHAAHLATPEFQKYSGQANALFSAPPVKNRVN